MGGLTNLESEGELDKSVTACSKNGVIPCSKNDEKSNGQVCLSHQRERERERERERLVNRTKVSPRLSVEPILTMELWSGNSM